ncbi:MAG: hypothetical protein R3181_00260 [Rubricoccaceae bacterium]|nr:hypothetical protein [Rubricoccaceae bacterium]
MGPIQLAVRDVAASRRFFLWYLNFHVVEDGGGEQDAVTLSSGDAALRLVRRPPEEVLGAVAAQSRPWILLADLAGLQSVVKDLTSGGVPVAKAPVNEGVGVLVSDPDGYQFVIAAPMPATPEAA